MFRAQVQWRYMSPVYFPAVVSSKQNWGEYYYRFFRWISGKCSEVRIFNYIPLVESFYSCLCAFWSRNSDTTRFLPYLLLTLTATASMLCGSIGIVTLVIHPCSSEFSLKFTSSWPFCNFTNVKILTKKFCSSVSDYTLRSQEKDIRRKIAARNFTRTSWSTRNWQNGRISVNDSVA